MRILLVVALVVITVAFGPGGAAATIEVPRDYGSIQSAIDAASPGDQVLVSAGLYNEHVVLKSDVQLVGSGASNTTIEGDGTGAVVFAQDVNNVLISGFRIRRPGPRCWKNPEVPDPPHGANIAIIDSQDVTISHNELVGELAEFDCGVKFFRSTGLITANRITKHDAPLVVARFAAPTISGNEVVDNAHGIFSHVSTPRIEGNIIRRNGQYGIYYVFGNPVIVSNMLYDQHYGIFASGFDFPVLVENNLIFDNAVGIRCEQSIPRLGSNTIVNNRIGLELSVGFSAPEVFNNIFAFNSEVSLHSLGSCPVAVQSNDFFGSPVHFSGCPDPGGNFFLDPGFRDAPSHDFRLAPSSPIIDIGSNLTSSQPYDLDGRSRIIDGDGDNVPVIDPGAYEFDPTEDRDGDGVIDSEDHCLGTKTGEIVNEQGCAISQLCPCIPEAEVETWGNHGQYVKCVVHTSHDFRNSGLITEEEVAKLVLAAARSICGVDRI